MKFSQLRPINESAIIADYAVSDNNLYCMDGIQAALDAIENNADASYELNDGNTVTLSPQVAAEIIATYDELNESNADAMNVLLKDSEASFVAAVYFCEQFVKEYLKLDETSDSPRTIYTANKKRAERLIASGIKVKPAPHRSKEAQAKMLSNVAKAGGLASKLLANQKKDQ